MRALGGQWCGYSSKPGLGPSAGAVSQEDMCQVGHTESEVSEEQRGQRFPPSVLREVCHQRERPGSRCFTRQLPSDHKDTERKWAHWDSCWRFPPKLQHTPTGLSPDPGGSKCSTASHHLHDWSTLGRVLG